MEVQDPLAIFSSPEYGDDTYTKSVHFREPDRIILDTVDNKRGLYFADDFAEFAEEMEKRASAYPTTKRDPSRKNPLTAAKVANHWRKTNFPEEKKRITPSRDLLLPSRMPSTWQPLRPETPRMRRRW